MRLGVIAIALVMGVGATIPAAAQDNAPAEKVSAPHFSLTRGQVARLKSWLNLSAEQQQHWPPVEAVLYEIADNSAHGGIDNNAVSKLSMVAGPLLATMSTMQKQVAMRFARLMGVQKEAMNF